MPATPGARTDHALEPPPVLPRGSAIRGANVSRLLAPGRVARLPDRSVGQWLVRARVIARYSGGAAPASHRFPCPAFAVNASIVFESTPVAGRRQARRPTVA